MKWLPLRLAAPVFIGLLGCLAAGCAEAARRPNVLFVVIDDLNGWIGCLGDPQSLTPNIDRLAARGVLFERAYCTAPLCNPSRTSVLTGLRPSTTGIYDNLQILSQAPRLQGVVTLPEHFGAHGYRAVSCGKVFHKHLGQPDFDARYWDEVLQPEPVEVAEEPAVIPASGLRVVGGESGAELQVSDEELQALPAERREAVLARRQLLRDFLDWGPLDVAAEETPDFKTVERVVGELQQEHTAPFFLACGIHRPHLPWYVPREYFERFPEHAIALPEAPVDDLEDAGVPTGPSDDHLAVVAQGKWPSAVRGYLAAVAYADDCLGRLIEALDQSEYADETIVVLWSDNGFHLGEKQRWRKESLWEEAARTPLIVVAPGVTEPGGRCGRAVSLLDLYPTLVELGGLPSPGDLEGRSLVPLLRSPGQAWDVPAITTGGLGQHAVRTERWTYIDYAGEGEELYDRDQDPGEFRNLAQDPAHAAIKAELAGHLPAHNEPPAPYEEIVNRIRSRSGSW